jgi:simple sugar transport system permease protein
VNGNETLKKFFRLFEWNKLSTVFTMILGVAVGFSLTAFLLVSQGVSPLKAYGSMFLGAFGSIPELSFTLLEFIPLGLAGLAVTLAYRCGVFNIGVEGQLYIAALFTTWIAVSFSDMPGYLLFPLCLLGGVAAAALFAAIPAVLKAKLGMNEVLICMLLNYVGINMVGLAVNSFLKSPASPHPASDMLPRSTWLPVLIKGTYLHVGILFVFVIAIILYWLLLKTTTGYEIRSIGHSPVASRYSGINVQRVMILSMIGSGMIAGMVGSVVILGTHHRLLSNFLVNYGYDAIAVSLLGGLNPFGVLVTALFFGALKSGGNAMQIAMGIPVSVVSVVVAVAILSIIAINQIRTLFFKRKRR